MSNSHMIDLRSDTVTLPNSEMLKSIEGVLLGDDIMGEDPTVNELEAKAADLLGMEAALLVISGTMANQAAIMSFCGRGEEIIMGEESHIYTMEGAATATVAQAQIRPMTVLNGIYDVEKMERLIARGDIQQPKTALITLENSYNLNKGEIVTLENMKEIREMSKQYNIPVYLDGARLFNSTVELNISPAEICNEVDAVQFCLTKGLGCPLGSILAGSKQFIKQATMNRQRLGGGMRQAGIIAAPALYALDHMIDRLSMDNKRAKYLAERLSKLDGIDIRSSDVHTNIVSPKLVKYDWDSDKIIRFLLKQGIKVKNIGKKQVRMIVHYQITDFDIDKVIEAFTKFTTSFQS